VGSLDLGDIVALQLLGKRALVTGAASGIGAAIVARFRAEGAWVAGLDLNPAMNSDFDQVGDLRSDAFIDSAWAALVQRQAMPDIVVHAAAISAHGGVIDTAPERYAEIYAVNVLAAVRLMRHCVPAMKAKGGGSVLLMSSINADFATPTQAAYAASKAALNSLTKTAALEFAPAGIRVNAIAPASIDTPLMRAGLEAGPNAQQAIAANMQRHPLARFGTAKEVAELSLFLVSDRAAWITGAIYPLDGGASVTRR
jgi:NAD(P)-dependent dehydrogenase (short-subunit alcohol dehydrogenase family)